MEFYSFFINNNCLHFACNSGNITLVKYIISLNVFDINEENNDILNVILKCN